jgi:acyl-CoA hydrolase
MKTFVACHLVKGQDLNHHGTLYAGRQAEWFVESGFVAAAIITKPENIVCVQIHGMKFKRPVKKGEVIKYESRIVDVGLTKLIAHVNVTGSQDEGTIVDGFLTFVHVDSQGAPVPHGLSDVVAVTEEERAIQLRAQQL